MHIKEKFSDSLKTEFSTLDTDRLYIRLVLQYSLQHIDGKFSSQYSFISQLTIQKVYNKIKFIELEVESFLTLLAFVGILSVYIQRERLSCPNSLRSIESGQFLIINKEAVF